MKTKQRPFKKFFCDRPEVFLLPPLALKIWLYHYTREGKDRRSWPSVETIMKKCGIAKDDTVYKWRAWLQQHGWLKKVGEIPSKNAWEYATPIFKVTRGIIPLAVDVPHQTGDETTPSNGGRDHPVERGTRPPHQTGVEVDSQKQVEPQKQVEAKRGVSVTVSVGDESTDTLNGNRSALIETPSGPIYPHIKPQYINGNSYRSGCGNAEKPKNHPWVFDPVYKRYHLAEDIGDPGDGLLVPEDSSWINRCPNCPDEPVHYVVNARHELIQEKVCFDCKAFGEEKI